MRTLAHYSEQYFLNCVSRNFKVLWRYLKRFPNKIYEFKKKINELAYIHNLIIFKLLFTYTSVTTNLYNYLINSLEQGEINGTITMTSITNN